MNTRLLTALRCTSCGRNLPADAFRMVRRGDWQWRAQPCKRCVELGRRERLGRQLAGRGLDGAECEKCGSPIPPADHAGEQRRYCSLRCQHLACQIARKHRKRSAEATLTEAGWLDILAAFNHKCAYCDADLPPVHRDHVVPVIAGGGYTKENIVPSCPKCNAKKNSHELRSWLQDEDRYQFVCDMRS